MLSIILIKTTPAKNARRLHLFVSENLLILNRMFPMTTLACAHKTFTIGDDNPFPVDLQMVRENCHRIPRERNVNGVG